MFQSWCTVCPLIAQESLRLSLLDNFPNDGLLIAFHHPCDKDIKVFIGGEMPHLVKKIVNRLESSFSSKSKVTLKFRGEAMSLQMIKKAWLWDDEGFGATRKTVLTEDHFYKNAYSRMRVHLAVQVLSRSVGYLIDRYTSDNELRDEMGSSLAEKYSPLKDIVLACDKLVDIWNANYSKGYECLNSPDHSSLKELHSIMLLFAEWKNGCQKKEEFITSGHGMIYAG